ncbi:MAG: hypothetical protein M3Z24_04640 [Chloroflexota bacterium]|nr:hypothetical protein [Chloroflexota bacterium]
MTPTFLPNLSAHPFQASYGEVSSAAVRDGYGVERIKREVAKCTVLCANCHAKLHYEWARKNNKPLQEGLAGQFLEVEQVLSVSQEEEFAHAAENQYIPDGVEIYDNPDVGP